MKILIRFFNWLTGSYWKPVKSGGSWGIYHPTLRHDWSYGMTLGEAIAECNRRNRE